MLLKKIRVFFPSIKRIYIKSKEQTESVVLIFFASGISFHDNIVTGHIGKGRTLLVRLQFERSRLLSNHHHPCCLNSWPMKTKY